MTSLDDFDRDVETADIRLVVNSSGLNRALTSSIDTVFHVPLLALCILVVTRGEKGALATSDIAVWTAATLSRYFSTMTESRRRLEWALPHRRRCADALVFLESVQLLRVEERPDRQIECTPEGMTFVREMLARQDEVGFFCRGLDRAYRAVEHHGIRLL